MCSGRGPYARFRNDNSGYDDENLQETYIFHNYYFLVELEQNFKNVQEKKNLVNKYFVSINKKPYYKLRRLIVISVLQMINSRGFFIGLFSKYKKLNQVCFFS